MAEKVIKGGIIPKVEACVRVVRDGVEKAHILDGRKHHAILLELLTDQGVGTMIRKELKVAEKDIAYRCELP